MKPLFQITSGDLGMTAQEVEKALETNFALASRWDCILLLDKADVFLGQLQQRKILFEMAWWQHSSASWSTTRASCFERPTG
ncbi:hypothetical protein CONLIGDRAFT_693108 [Coniochaeta ligniaria NRRL 30616]|uniref:ATPase AAA-type core domain-containing protein n=1 Tax=Coniochaeta ligniaria NRRL 30616 TaxID=1408157 RepID=A0A1J7IQL9_9PEZI|nr:hypothetical protein CONLIGDRAFT_693108 [Coniochaeta ligniaria NRRL 30616]